MFLQLLKKENISDINIETAKAIARWIKKCHPTVTVYITGSVLKPNLIHIGSDIDIAIRGIKEDDYVSLIKDVYHQFPSLKVDMRRMDELDSYIQQKIIDKGYMV